MSGSIRKKHFVNVAPHFLECKATWSCESFHVTFNLTAVTNGLMELDGGSKYAFFIKIVFLGMTQIFKLC
jgi:hypothetical protein